MDASADRRAGAGSSALVIVANRLPVQPSQADGVAWRQSPGGLVTALLSALRTSGGVWVGWPGAAHAGTPPSELDGIGLDAIELRDDEVEQFYLGFSNATLWPLYHDAVRAPQYHRDWWRAYARVNERFAARAAARAALGATVWVHDYQLQLVPRLLRELRPDVRIGFFLHVPFPPRELFLQLPWRRELLAGLLGADLVGFQTPGAAANFSRLARQLFSAKGTNAELELDGRRIGVGAFPISVDGHELSRRAARRDVAERSRALRHELGDPELVLLGVDRLDYTKGIHERIRAVAELFAEGTLEAGRHVMVQIAVPTREEDHHYLEERHHLEQVVSEVNGEHAVVGHPAVHYLHQSLELDELVAMYLLADVMLVTPFRDGMNLVAKEYVVTRNDLTGALVLSEFAGAAQELRGAFTVNPHDMEGMKEIIRTALETDAAARRARMLRMRRAVLRHDVHAWSREFLAALRSPASAPPAAAQRPASARQAV